MNKNNKVVVIGLDCATPQLVFDAWLDDLPTIKKLVSSGTYGKLRSTDPPITCPAWMSMVTGKDPGMLGLYGFRNRQDYSYHNLKLASSLSVKEKTIWDLASNAGKKSIVIGVPPSYPPQPIDGIMVSCFLTPGPGSRYTYPPEIKNELEQLVGEYLPDVTFRTDDKDRLLSEIYRMTDKRFRVAGCLMKKYPWDFFMLVEMGPDRIHHGFWKYMDKDHPKYIPGNKYEHAIKDYYIYLDQKINQLLSFTDGDPLILVVSDHGAKRMLGGISINQWLVREGYLALLEEPQEITPFSKAKINWDKTLAWGEGGYYSRIFFNVKGRETRGIVPPEKYRCIQDDLKNKLQNMTDEKGNLLNTRVFRPEDMYRKFSNIPPDLIVYLGDLYWRSVGSLGHGSIFVYDNDTGPDDANHDYYGIFIMHGKPARGLTEGLKITDVAPTVLDYLGLPLGQDMIGQIIE